jgi:hypothetical protein
VDTAQIITAAIACISLIISITSLGITIYYKRRELEKERRTISIIIQPVTFTDAIQLLITNTGHRPIAIRSVSIGFKLKSDGRIYADFIPAGMIFELGKGNTGLPATLEDGQTATLFFSELARLRLYESDIDTEVLLTVYDYDGNAYHSFKVNVYNAKFDSNESIPEKWRRHKRFLGIKLPLRFFGERT